MSVADFENLMSFDKPIHSSIAPRWQRKAAREEAVGADRFIPNRSSSSADSLNCNDCGESVDEDRSNMMEEEMIGHGPSRILSFKNKAPAPKDGYQSNLKVLYSQAKKSVVSKPMRHIPSAPVRILDAPDMMDDYYLNLLSWGANNKLAVALSQNVYIWDAASGNIKELMSLESESDVNNQDYIGSVAWIQDGGSHLAMGCSSGVVQLWDVEAGKQVRSLSGHAGRVGALAWNNHILSSGSRDSSIINHDVRIRDHKVAVLQHHSQEVCGLAWSPDGQILASGGNDNKLCLWDCHDGSSRSGSNSNVFAPKHVCNEHQAAVKALAWSPHERHLLASGGGSADRHIRFWNADSGVQVNSIDAGSQVCALQWSPHEKEILSSHGYAENQLCLWKYPSLSKMKELKGHSSRVLHMAVSPDGSLVCSGAPDESLRFWNIFAKDVKRGAASGVGANGIAKGIDNAAKSGLQGASKSLRIR